MKTKLNNRQRDLRAYGFFKKATGFQPNAYVLDSFIPEANPHEREKQIQKLK